MSIGAKINRKLLHLRLRPIRVFCFHQVSDYFDESTMYREDWMQTVEFQETIKSLRNDGYAFISLSEAYEKLKYDTFRFRKYAVLTADDGFASLCNVLSWLDEQSIPVTLFLNPLYLDGCHFRIKETEKYLTEEEIKQLCMHYPLLTIGSHGWEHIDPAKQSEQEFSENLVRSIHYLEQLPNYIPFFAIPYGDYSLKFANIVRSHHLIPLTVLGGKNYLEQDYIDRELLGC